MTCARFDKSASLFEAVGNLDVVFVFLTWKITWSVLMRALFGRSGAAQADLAWFNRNWRYMAVRAELSFHFPISF
jgi:hypothetical protein